ncbi:uncharacterized protein BJ171DRAFT_425363 [Polychytrium aggregatum]|uniref:uncharacterized protein n=1 Tax=Polychytrium aggregatum TaxID=110093 RepID=UPI0022FF45AF|nr:uncharacterized protein BJ171DRAFT_425363 [Polychytrium aggregatum]KAI9203539.1 hypothetical protein BJ171DRAFT_425363 [Polychytrium aggregatum]
MPDPTQTSFSHNPDIFAIVCCNDSFQLALDHITIKTLLRVCKRARPLLSSKLPRFRKWCQKAKLYYQDGEPWIRLTPSDQIALSLHCEDPVTTDRSWLEIQSEQGNAAASFFLANIVQIDLDYGPSLNNSERQAIHQQIFRLFESAANTNHAMAQFDLAECYRNGTGVTQDHTKAAGLYRRLAECGISRAQIALGRCYESGEGVDQDYDTAVEWYSRAADQENEDGRLHIVHLMAVCLFLGFGTDEDQEKAAVIFEQLANEGHSDSQFWIGECYRSGGGVSEDAKKAFEWFSRSADQGNSYGQWLVGLGYYYGYGVTKDHTKAAEWLRKSAEQGNRYGQCHLGHRYEKGEGVPQDTDTAVFWWRKSAKQRSGNAIFNLQYLGKWP